MPGVTFIEPESVQLVEPGTTARLLLVPVRLSPLGRPALNEPAPTLNSVEAMSELPAESTSSAATVTGAMVVFGNTDWLPLGAATATGASFTAVTVIVTVATLRVERAVVGLVGEAVRAVVVRRPACR